MNGKLNLSKIISICEIGTSSINTEVLAKYKKSLYIYFKSYYNCEPVLMVTDVFNAVSYAIIVPANEFQDAIDVYLNESDLTDDDKMNQSELISSQSIMLSDF